MGTKYNQEKVKQLLLNYCQVKRLEDKLSKNCCHKNRINTNPNNNIDKIKETVSIISPNKLIGQVLVIIGVLHGVKSLSILGSLLFPLLKTRSLNSGSSLARP